MLLYLSTTPANDWVFNEALQSYVIEHRDRDVAALEFRKDLKEIANNVNYLKNVKEKAKSWLENFSKLSKEPKNKGKLVMKLQASKSIINNNNAENITINQNIPSSSSTPDIVSKKRKIMSDEFQVDENEVLELLKQAEETEVEEYPPIILKNSNIKIIYPSNHYFIKFNSNQINISMKFLEFQKFVINSCNSSGLLLENHTHHILALSSVLLLKPNQHHLDLLDFFNTEELKILRCDTLSYLAGDKFEDIEFDQDIFIKIRKVLKELLKTNGNAYDCIKSLSHLIDQENEFESKIILCIISYINSLPETKPIDHLGEIELCASLLNPLLSSLFYEKNASILRWCNKVTEESKESKVNVNKSRRPDAIISTICQKHFGASRGFGEAKVGESINNTYGLVRDLVRLSTFAKESIDLNNMKCNLSFQAVGAHVMFYANTLLSDGLYIMVEIGDVVVPSCLEDLLSFLSEFDKLKLVYTIYKSSCIESEKEIETSWKRTTLDSPTFNDYVSKSGSSYKNRSGTLSFN